MDIACRDKRPGDLISFGEACELGRPSLPPQPYAMGRLQTSLSALIVDRMIAENDQRRIHQLPQDVRSITAREVLADRTIDNLVRIKTDRAHLSADPDHQMAMAGTGIKLNRLGTELLVDGVNQFARLFVVESPCRGIIHHDGRPQFLDLCRGAFVLRCPCSKRHQVASKDRVVLSHQNS